MSSAEVEELARLRHGQSRIEATLREVDARLAEYGQLPHYALRAYALPRELHR
ncbi:MAG: hypothetical protein JJU22_10690 [Gammaproteobacteria bacterium]|nr:hypothetical protein [Gammaproteobacteria bacterium]